MSLSSLWGPSYTATTDYPGFVKSPRMWSQYAKGQSGVCLAFSRSRLIRAVKENVSDPGAYQFGDVQYRDYPFQHQLTLPKDFVRRCTAFELHRHVFFEKYRHVFFEKHTDYAEEKEFRILYTGDLDSPYLQFKDALLAVILGKSVNDAVLPSVRQFQAQNIRYFRNGYGNGYPSAREIVES